MDERTEAAESIAAETMTTESIEAKMLTESGRVLIVQSGVDIDVVTPEWHCHSHRCTTECRELLRQPLKDDLSLV